MLYSKYQSSRFVFLAKKIFVNVLIFFYENNLISVRVRPFLARGSLFEKTRIGCSTEKETTEK